MAEDDDLNADLTKEDSFSEMISVQRVSTHEVRERTRRQVALILCTMYVVSNTFVLGLVGTLTYYAGPAARVEVARQMLVVTVAYLAGSTTLFAAVLRYYFKRA